MIPLLNRDEFKTGLLTAREKQVADLLTSEGLSNREIAERLGISERWVKCNMLELMRKTGVRNRVELAVLWKTEIFQIGLSA